MGASVPGFLHVKAGRGCDDAHGWHVADEFTALVVADGAGSRPGTSAIGSHTAVAAVLDACAASGFVAAYADDPTAAILAVFQSAIAGVETEAASLEVNATDLATTLSVAVLSPVAVTIGQIGDCIAVIERNEGATEAVAVADHFQYANETVFVTASDALHHLKLFSAAVDGVKNVALSTDGLKYKVLDDPQTSRPFEQFFRDSWNYARSEQASSAAIEAFLRDVDDQTGDDKTLLLAVRDFVGEHGSHHQITERPTERGESSVPPMRSIQRRPSPRT